MARQALPCLQPGCGNDTLNAERLCWQHVSSLENAAKLQDRGGIPSVVLSGDNTHLQGNDRPEFIPRDEQREIVRNAMNIFEDPNKDRCKVVAACGMGKTGASQMLVDEYDAMLQSTQGRSGVYLVTAPSISLAQQLRKDYLKNGIIGELDEENCLSVHDDSVNIDRFRKDHGYQDNGHDQEMVEEFLRKRPDDKPTVIFAVNDSLHKISQAQRSTEQDFDLAMIDEAHHLGGQKRRGRSKEADKKLLPLYFNEQEGGIRSDNRFFMTATPVYSTQEEKRQIDYMGPRRGRDRTGRKAIEDFESGKSKSVMIDQSSEELFGETVGNYSYAYAVNKGYLMQPRFVRSQVHIRTGDRHLDRRSRVDYSGEVATSQSQGMSLGAYSSTVSAMEAVVSPDNAHNALVFSDRITEVHEVVDNWEPVARAQSRSLLNGNDISVDEAKMMVEHGDGFTPEQVKGAKYRLLAEYASPVATSSNEPEAVQQRALNHFDDRGRGEAGKECRCGQPGRWCACARVVSNVDMLGEGISIDSIDAVVLNRPRMPQDSAITQAMGRASRRWKGENENGEEIDLKDSSQIIVPQVYGTDSDESTSEMLAKDALPALNALSRTMRNFRESRFDGREDYEPAPIETEGMAYSMEMEHYSAYPEFIVSEELQGEERRKEAQHISDEVRLLDDTWSAAWRETSKNYDDQHPGERFADLPYDEQCRNTQRHCMTTDNADQRMLGAALKNHQVTISNIESAQAFIRDKSNRAQWMDTYAMEPGDTVQGYEVQYDGNVLYSIDRDRIKTNDRQRIFARMVKRLHG